MLLTIGAYNLPSLLPPSSLGLSPLELSLVKLLLSACTLLLGTFITLFLVARAYQAQVKQHVLELQDQHQHYQSLASLEKERNRNFNKKLDYPSLGGEGSWMD